MVSPLGWPQWGATFFDASRKLVQFNRAGTTTAVDELDSIALVCRNALHDGVVGQIIEEWHILQVSAPGSRQMGSGIA